MSSEITRGTRPLKHPLAESELEFVAKTALQQQSAKSALIMTNINNTTDPVQFAQAVCSDLEIVKDRYRATWGHELDIILLSVQINIYAFQLQAQNQVQRDSNGAHNKLQPDVSSKTLLHCGFTASIRLIHNYYELASKSRSRRRVSSGTHNGQTLFLQRYLPKHFFSSLFLATSFVFKYIAICASELPCWDGDLASNHIRLAYSILTSSSLDEQDEPAQAARKIQVLSRAKDLSRLKVSDSRSDMGSRLRLVDDTVRAAQELRKSVRQNVNSDGSNSTFAKSPSTLIRDSDDGTAHRQSGMLNISEPSSADFNVDIGQDFDWNSLMGYDFSVLQFLDFEMHDGTNQNPARR